MLFRLKKCISAALVLGLLLTLAVIPVSVSADTAFTEVGGWYESLYATISGVTDSQVTGVSWSGTSSGSLTGEDFTYLVRDAGDGVRIDIPGLKAGTYTLTVSTESGTYSQSGIAVSAYDRSGFAHYNYTEGVGAYKDDGTLKDNAIVLYVTNESKNTVTVKAKDGTTVSGIGNILNSAGAKGVSSGAYNTNSGILQKLAEEGRPLVVRIIGNVTAPEGLTAWGSKDYGGGTDDNGSLARMQNCKNITIEGIGSGATCNGWGFSIDCKSGTSSKGLGKSFEFRNITFKNVPEDCIGLAGTMSGGALTDPIERCWVHHCAFYGPSGIKDASEDQDKGEGDGAFDFKRGQYCTLGYCYFEGYHKTSLVGGGDTDMQYHITWHHTYWKNCESRGPLGRQANMHMYNNVVEGQSSYCMSLRANLYIFSEYNTFINSKNVVDGNAGGVVKSYNNTFKNSTGTNRSHLVIVTDKNAQVTSQNKYANFDTNAALSYIPSGNYFLQTDADEIYKTVTTQAGPQKGKQEEPEDSEPIIPDASAGAQIHNFTANALNSSFYTFTSCNTNNGKGTVNYAGLTMTVCLKMESATNVSFEAPADGDLLLVFHENGYNGATAAGSTVKLNGKAYTVEADNTVLIPVTAGTNTLTRGSAQIFLYYMAYIPEAAAHNHSYTATVTKAATCTTSGETTYTCSCGDSYKETVAATGHSYKGVVTAPSCTSGGFTTYTCANCGSGYRGSFTSATGHSYANGICTACGEADPDYVGLFDLAGANLELANDITMYFYVNAADVADGYYMEIVKTNADGSKVTRKVEKADWDAYGSTMYYVGFNGMAAKEMADEIAVTVYNAEGTQVSNTTVTSISAYALRALDNAAYAKMHTLMADLLNYGAAAQTFFKYNTANLANANMTETHKGYATKDFNMADYTNDAVAGAGAVGANLSLETNILQNFFFDPAVVDSTMTAHIHYVSDKGAEVRAVVTGDKFTAVGNYVCVEVGILVPADVMSLVTVVIMDVDGNIVASVKDSISSYAVRAYGRAATDTEKALYVELMEYCLSCKNYFR